jgi:PAS domain-containing protein
MVGMVGLLPLPRAKCQECHPLGQFAWRGRIEPTIPTKPTSHAAPELRRVGNRQPHVAEANHHAAAASGAVGRPPASVGRHRPWDRHGSAARRRSCRLRRRAPTTPAQRGRNLGRTVVLRAPRLSARRVTHIDIACPDCWAAGSRRRRAVDAFGHFVGRARCAGRGQSDAGEGQRPPAVVAGLPAAIYATDALGVVTYHNRACIASTGRTPRIGQDT